LPGSGDDSDPMSAVEIIVTEDSGPATADFKGSSALVQSQQPLRILYRRRE